MFEFFTDRARKVLELAKSQARTAGQDYVGTEHILLGLIKESSGVAHHILDCNGITSSGMLKEIEKVVQPGSGTAKNPDFTPRAKKVFEYSVEEATALGHNYIGTEHILLGLLREVAGTAYQILQNLGLNVEQLRKETFNILGFYDRNFILTPYTDEKDVFSVVAKDSTGEEIIGRYATESDELLFNRPIPIIEIQKIIESIRNYNDEKKLKMGILQS